MQMPEVLAISVFLRRGAFAPGRETAGGTLFCSSFRDGLEQNGRCFFHKKIL
jgi:hypothetical protein